MSRGWLDGGSVDSKNGRKEQNEPVTKQPTPLKRKLAANGVADDATSELDLPDSVKCSESSQNVNNGEYEVEEADSARLPNQRRENRSDPPMPPHISTQVSKSTHSSVGGGGTTSGGGSGQQLLSPPKPQSDSSSVATFRENEEGSCGPVPMDTAPPCVVIDRQGRAELLVGMPHVPQYQGMGEEEGQDSFKQQKQSETSSQGKQPDTTQSVTPPQSPGAEDSLSSVKCVDCDIPLSAEVTRQREDGREALVCDVCRKAHLSHVQDDDDDFMDEASANTQLSQPNVVSEGPQCKLLGCNEQAQVESGEYKEFCSKGHYKMFSMMTSTPVSPMAAASQRSPMATTVTTPQSSGAEDSLSPVKCVDCDRVLSAEEIRQRKDGGEALVCDVCRTALLGGVQDDDDDFTDEAGTDIRVQLSPEVVCEGLQCKLPGCNQRAQVESGEYKKFCTGRPNLIFTMMTPAPVSIMSLMFQMLPLSPTVPPQSGEAPTCQYPECSEVCAVDGNGRVLACCEVHRIREERQLMEHRGSQRDARSSRDRGHTPQHRPPVPTPTLKHCKFPGCQRLCSVDRDGHVHDACGWCPAQQHQAQQTSSSGAEQSQHTDDGQEGMIEWIAGKIGATLFGTYFSSHADSSNHDNTGNYEKRSTQQRGTHPIKFYHKHDPYYEFTNFYQAPLQIDGRLWATSENYFQAQKYIGTPLFDAIQQSKTPREAFDISRTPVLGLQWRRSDWEEVKDDVMYVALYAKFTQHERLRRLLLDTGECQLIEHTSRDSYWGDGGDGSGQNKLGQLLIKVREELRKEVEAAAAKHISHRGRNHRSESGAGPQSMAKTNSRTDMLDTGTSVDLEI